jgi:two-component system sensor histidine kinase MtrB
MAQGHLDVRLSVDGSDELADLSRSFNETAAALERSVAELRRLEAQARRFVADVSHELRTPLAAMSAVTDVLDDASHLDGTTADAVRLVSQETVRLTRLVGDLMEISRFDAGAAVLSLDEIDLADSVRNSLASRGWQDAVPVAVAAPGPLRVRVDPRRLDVVTANVVGNALRHGAAPVELHLRAAGAYAVIEVTDSGPGIADEDLPHIFERFYKADANRTRSESSGLGLAITAENVRLHGGRLRVANRPGKGAVFTIELPLALSLSLPVPPGPRTGADTGHAPGSASASGSAPDRGYGPDLRSGPDRTSRGTGAGAGPDADSGSGSGHGGEHA